MPDYAPKPGYSFPGPPPAEALAYFRAKGLKPAFDHRDVWAEEHAASFTVAKAMQLDVLETIRAEVDRALADGQTFAQFRQELKPRLVALGWWGEQEQADPLTGEQRLVQHGSPRRLKTIYDTNLRTARAAGQWQRIQRTKATLPYLLYQLGPSREHRVEHANWHGTLLPADHPFWQSHFTPNGYGCKCHIRQVSRTEAERRGGVTEAPTVKTREWVNQRSGEVLRVPAGIDPGWDYNPGAVARQTHAARVFGEKVQTAAAPLGAEAMVSSTQFVRAGLADDYQAWLRPLIQHERRHQGEVRLVSALRPGVIDKLRARGITLDTAAITLKDATAEHLSRDGKRGRDASLPEADLLALPALLSQPQAVLWHRNELVLVFPTSIEGKLGKVVVKPNYGDNGRLENQRKQIRTNSVRTAGLVERKNVATDEYEVLEGEI